MPEQVADPWRTLRFFLSEDGVHEVCFDHTGSRRVLRCDCEGFLKQGGCAHVKWSTANDLKEDGALKRRVHSLKLRDAAKWRSEVIGTVRVEVI